jgi:hypothetical protein
MIIKIEDTQGYVSQKKTLLTDSIYISADYAIISKYNLSPDDGEIYI